MMIELAIVVRERVNRAAVEGTALYRAVLEHGALGRNELVEACGEQGLDRWRDVHLLSTRVPDEGKHLLEEERIALRHLHDPLVKLGGHLPELREQPLRLARVERLEQNGGRVPLAATPRRPTLQQLRPRQAQQQDGRITREVGEVLDEIEQRLLGPVQVVEDADERLRLRLLLEQLAKAPGDLLGARGKLRLAEQRPQWPRRVALQRPELLQNLNDRPVRDPLAVGEAAAAQHPRFEACQELG